MTVKVVQQQVAGPLHASQYQESKQNTRDSWSDCAARVVPSRFPQLPAFLGCLPYTVLAGGLVTITNMMWQSAGLTSKARTHACIVPEFTCLCLQRHRYPQMVMQTAQKPCTSAMNLLTRQYCQVTQAGCHCQANTRVAIQAPV